MNPNHVSSKFWNSIYSFSVIILELTSSPVEHIFTFLSSLSQAIYPLLSWYCRPKYLNFHFVNFCWKSEPDKLETTLPGFSEPNCPTNKVEEFLSGRLERIVDPSQNMIIGIIMDHLVIQAKLKLCIHGADLDWEDLAHLLPPDHQLFFLILWVLSCTNVRENPT